MIGPEWVAQQKKFVSSRMANWGDRTARPTDISACVSPFCGVAALPAASAGGRRTNSDTGIMMTATITATICIVVRQSCTETSHATSGAMVMGAIPMPADTSETARLRWVSNQPVTVAIIGAKIAAIEPPTRAPKMNWNANSEVAWLASARLAASTTDPVSTTGRGPPPVGQGAPSHAATRHRQKSDRHRTRYAGDRPAGITHDRLEQDRQRKHRPDRDAAQGAAGRDNDPTIARMVHSRSPLWLFSAQDEWEGPKATGAG
jgi:hypothetical protein